MRGILKLFTHIKIGEIPENAMKCGKYYKRLNLVTFYSATIHENHTAYIDEFKNLNPEFRDVEINYEFTIRKIG